ncbi:MAG TPA: hypothetical protein VGL81_03755 [Polyangiaceae bacterium]|jgi:hypothetical protein
MWGINLESRAAGAVAIALACTGCAEGGAAGAASKPAVVFPSRDEIARIPAEVPRAEAFGMADVAVETWSFESQASSDAAAYEDASPWGDVVRELVKAHPANLTPSAPLKCAAQELARFHAKNGAMPTESLRRFVAARCGAVSSGITPMFWSVTSPIPISDAELAPKAGEGFAKRLGVRLQTEHWLLGVASAREGQRTSAVAVLARDEAKLEPGTLTVDASRRVTLRGAARGDFAEIGALVNRGDVGTAPCVPDPRVKAPRFALTCELAPGDTFAWVEVLGRRPGQLLLHELAETIINEGDRSALVYAAHHVGPPATVKDGPAFSRSLLDGLNRVRTNAHMAPLSLASEQSAENTRLAGTLVDAMISSDETVTNRAAIGLMAGWEVKGLIRNGNFFIAAVGTSDATAWLDFAIERPIGRSSLLDPAMRIIAIGPAIPPGGGALGAAVTAYALFETDDHSADATRFFGRVAAARAARGLSAPVREPGFREMDAQLARIARAGGAPMDALQATMRAAVARTGQGVHGYTLETNDLDQVPVPEALLAPVPMRMAIGVTHHRAEGAAWGQYVVMVVLLGRDEGMTAVQLGPHPVRFVAQRAPVVR